MEILAVLSVIWQPVVLALMVAWTILYAIRQSPTQADYDKETYDAVERHKKRMEE